MARSLLHVCVSLGIIATYLVACGEDIAPNVRSKDGGPLSSEDAAVIPNDVASSAPDFEILRAEASVVQGRSADVDVKVVRKGGFTGAVSLALLGLPSGVTAATPIVVPAGASATKVTLSADTLGAQGTTGATIEGSNAEGMLKKSSSFTVQVRGAPGTVDTTFGTKGRVELKVPGLSSADAIELLSDGKILVAGVHLQSPNVGFSLTKLDASGAVDASFGVGGTAVFLLGAGGLNGSVRMDLIRESTAGALYVGGSVRLPASSMRLFKVSAAGVQDLAFKPTVAEADGLFDLRIQAGGNVDALIDAASAPKRLIFDTSGSVASTPAFTVTSPKGACFAPDGGLWELGVLSSGTGLAQARYTSAAGVQGANFVATNDLGFGSAPVIRCAPTGDAVTLATRTNNTAFVSKVKQSGQADSAFGTAGELFVQKSFANYAMDSAGQIVTATQAVPLSIARLTVTGSVDASFGASGIAALGNTETQSRPQLKFTKDTIVVNATERERAVLYRIWQ
jgi:uncharacterized delta-60 repeat protein